MRRRRHGRPQTSDGDTFLPTFATRVLAGQARDQTGRSRPPSMKENTEIREQLASEAAALAAEELELEAEERALEQLEAEEAALRQLEAEEAALRAEESSLIAQGVSPFRVHLPKAHHLVEDAPSSPLREAPPSARHPLRVYSSSSFSSKAGASPGEPSPSPSAGVSPRTATAMSAASAAASAILFGRRARNAAVAIVSARSSGKEMAAAPATPQGARPRAAGEGGEEEEAALLEAEEAALIAEEAAELEAEEAALNAELAALEAEEAALHAVEVAQAGEAAKAEAKALDALRIALTTAKAEATDAAGRSARAADIAAEKAALAEDARAATARAAAAAQAAGLPPSPRRPSPRVADVRAQRASLEKSRQARAGSRVKDNPRLSKASSALLLDLLTAVHGPKPAGLSSTTVGGK